MDYVFDTAQILILFFVMLGPFKLLVPFAASTASLDQAALRSLAFRAVSIAGVGLIAAGFVGSKMLHAWGVPPEILLLAAGIAFFWVALRLVTAAYDRPALPVAGTPPPTPGQVAFPMVAPPYGVAAVIVIEAFSQDNERTLSWVMLLLAVMLLNLLVMIGIRPIMKILGTVFNQILGAIFSVLQLALALHLILMSWRAL